MAKAGFHHLALVERDRDCCDTIRLNKRRRLKFVRDWTILEQDLTRFDYAPFRGQVDVVAGGVPCQPFSIGGKHQAYHDERDMFPQFTNAIAELAPRAFIVENVKGLLRRSLRDYLDYLVLRLSHPTIRSDQGEGWQDHFRRLVTIHSSGTQTGLDYHVVWRLLNAADYGVPQRRERVFIVGVRSDLNTTFSFPRETHSYDALLRDQWVTGAYWERHDLPRPHANPERLRRRVETLPETVIGKPWRTVRDAIFDLRRLRIGEADETDPNHYRKPGAKTYQGHTGSPMDEPAKTIKAGNNGVSGGENALAIPDGPVRYFSVREAARLQTFPDSYWFSGAWTERMRQVGNAVPVELAYAIASEVRNQLP